MQSINNPQSVTMNTAEAVKEVLAMFNKTLDSQKHPTWESPSEDDECSPYLVKTNSIKGMNNCLSIENVKSTLCIYAQYCCCIYCCNLFFASPIFILVF